jgi:hypothetical protein
MVSSFVLSSIFPITLFPLLSNLLKLQSFTADYADESQIDADEIVIREFPFLKIPTDREFSRNLSLPELPGQVAKLDRTLRSISYPVKDTLSASIHVK